MKQLQRPPATYAHDLNGAMGPAQHRAHPTAVRIGTHQASAYDAASPSLHRLTCALTTRTRKFFLRLYESDKKGVAAIKARVRGLNVLDNLTAATCQYCSGLGPPSQLDHFLEKAVVPELALYAPNLVPSCGDCNNIRGRKRTFAKNGQRRALHFYDDDIKSLPQLLVVRLTMVGGVPKATYSIAASRHPLRAVFARHFQTLELEVRYATEAAAQLHLMRILARTTKKTATELVKHLREQAGSRIAAYGKNDHKAALFRAVAGSRTALAWAAKP